MEAEVENKNMNTEKLKEIVAFRAVDELVTSGMKLGIGTGSTALLAAARIGERYENGELKDLLVVPASFETRMECQKYGLNIHSLNDRVIDGELDLTIDGADEVDTRKNLIKGGGGGLLLEKIVGYVSRDYCIIVDQGKLVPHLCSNRGIPVEVIPEAMRSVSKHLEGLGGGVTLRMARMKAGPVITEKGNIILDTLFPAEILKDPVAMERELNSIPGVVENGLFTREVNFLYVAYRDGSVKKNPVL